MKKNSLHKIVISLLLCNCLILFGCATSNSQSAEVIEESVSVESTEIQEESVSEETLEVSEEPSEENLVTIRYDLLNVEEMILVDNEDFTYKITGVDPYDDNGTAYTLLTEEIIKTDNPKTVINIDYVTINGVDISGYGPIFTFDYIKLNQLGITDITDISIAYSICEIIDEGYNQVIESCEPIHIYPYGEEYAKRFVSENFNDETIIFENDYIKIKAIFLNDSTPNMLIENKTNEELHVSVQGTKINEYNTQSNTEYYLPANTLRFFDFIPFSLHTITENNIYQINNIELNIHVCDSMKLSFSISETINISTDIKINTIEYTNNEKTIETTSFENYDNLEEYAHSLNQSVGADFNFGRGDTEQTILYNGAHYTLKEGEDSICIIVPVTAIELAISLDNVDIYEPDPGEYHYWIWLDPTQQNVELPITILHNNGTIEKMTLYLTLN